MPKTPIPEKKCDYCRQPYTPIRRWGQNYCGASCRVHACNERAGRPHPRQTAAAKGRRRKEAGRTPSAVVPAAAAITNQQILAVLTELGQRMAALEQQQQRLLDAWGTAGPHSH